MPNKKHFELHPHLKSRMMQRGVSVEEIEIAIKNGILAKDARQGTVGKTQVFSYDKMWEGKHYKQKEVTVYYKRGDKNLIVLTVKACYGTNFPKEEE
jgi:hypothetical protein